MISHQETLTLSPYMAIYDIVVPKDHLLRQIKELVDFTFILEELKTNYCLDNGRKSKTIIVDATHTKAPAFQQTEEFSRLAKERYKVEAKNSELKNGHGSVQN